MLRTVHCLNPQLAVEIESDAFTERAVARFREFNPNENGLLMSHAITSLVLQLAPTVHPWAMQQRHLDAMMDIFDCAGAGGLSEHEFITLTRVVAIVQGEHREEARIKAAQKIEDVFRKRHAKGADKRDSSEIEAARRRREELELECAAEEERAQLEAARVIAAIQLQQMFRTRGARRMVQQLQLRKASLLWQQEHQARVKARRKAAEKLARLDTDQRIKAAQKQREERVERNRLVAEEEKEAQMIE